MGEKGIEAPAVAVGGGAISGVVGVGTTAARLAAASGLLGTDPVSTAAVSAATASTADPSAPSLAPGVDPAGTGNPVPPPES